MGVRSRWRPDSPPRTTGLEELPYRSRIAGPNGGRLESLAPRELNVFTTSPQFFYYFQQHCILQLVVSYSTKTKRFGKPAYRLTVGTTVVDWEVALETDDLAELEAMVSTHAELAADGSWTDDFLCLVETALDKYLGRRTL